MIYVLAFNLRQEERQATYQKQDLRELLRSMKVVVSSRVRTSEQNALVEFCRFHVPVFVDDGDPRVCVPLAFESIASFRGVSGQGGGW